MAETIFTGQAIKIKYDRTLNERVVFTKTYQLLWIFGGEGQIDFETTNIPLQPDSLYFIPIGTTYTIKPLSALSHVNLNIPIELLPLESIPKRTLLDVNTPLIKQSFATFLYNYRKLAEFDLEESSLNLINTIIRNSNHSSIKVNQVDDERVLQTLAYIESHYKQRFSVNDIADILHINPTYLATVFKKEVGTTIVKYTNARRLSNAFYKLQTTNSSITSIAYENGFADVRTFNELTKQRHGFSPKQLRQEIANIDNQAADDFGMYNQIIDKYKVVGNTQKTKVLHLDLNIRKSIGTFNNQYNTFAIGRAHDILYSSVQQQIINAKIDLNFKYCRFHNIFGDEMNIIDLDYLQNRELNFSKPLEVIDFLINLDIIPIIELGFFPKQVASSNNSPFTGHHVNLSGDIDFELWQQIIEQFISLLKHRYPKHFSKMKFDLWNEPDIDAFWPNGREYFIKLYKITYDTIKQIDDTILFGGLGFANFTAGDDLIAQFVGDLDDIGRIPDFISIHSYPLHLDVGSITNDVSTTKSIEYVHNKFNLDLDKCRQLKTKFNFKEIQISEWNTSPIQREYLNDSTYKSSKLINNIITSDVSDIDNICYWTLSDEMAEFGYATKEIHGGFGLITRKGIKKPAYYALNFINQIQTNIIYQDDHSLITSNQDTITILLNNEVSYSRDYNVNFGHNNADLMIGRDIEWNINLSNLVEGAYRMTTSTINTTNDLNYINETIPSSSDYLLNSDISTYNELSAPTIQTQVTQLGSEHELQIRLAPTETTLITIDKI